MAVRIGVVASAGGSVLGAAAPAASSILGTSFALVTDRPCGAEAHAARLGAPATRIEEPDNASFSAAAAAWLAAQGVDAVVLLFARIVTGALHEQLPTFNIHPSLLPAFRSFGAVGRARAAGVRVLGSTLHVATDDVDGGPIVAQAWDAVDPAAPIDTFEHVSFLQKTRLLLVLAELLTDGAIDADPSTGRAHVRGARPPASDTNPGLQRADLRRAAAPAEPRSGP